MTNKKILADWYKQIGCTEVVSETPIDRFAEAQGIVNAQQSTSTPSPAPHIKPGVVSPIAIESDSRQIADRCITLEDLREEVLKFQGCALKKTALKTVFADGNKDADLMLIGEAPGANEDAQGIPFCGQSGKLLDNIMLSIGISRENSYITNTVFWRPPGNRRPTPEELEICRPFVEKHIAFIKPKLIILVGSTAVEALLTNAENKTLSSFNMSAARSKHYMYKNRYLQQDIYTAVIFHPSYLLRQPTKKKDMWLDIQQINKKYLELKNA